MKKKIIIIILSIIGLIIISTSIYFIIQGNKKPVTYENEKTDDKTDIVEPTKTIEENDSKTNIANALYNISQKESFKTTTTGKSKALFSTQEIKDERIVIGSKAIVSTVSVGIVKLGKQKYLDKNTKKALIRDYETLSIDEVKWKEEAPEEITFDEYINRYGTLPFEASAYIINNDTIKTISDTIKVSDNEYKIELELKPNEAAFWYKHEIATDSGSTMEPDFEYVKLVYYLDSNINILKIEVEEKYKVEVIIQTTATTNRTEVFEYDNIKFREEDLAYFEKNKG